MNLSFVQTDLDARPQGRADGFAVSSMSGSAGPSLGLGGFDFSGGAQGLMRATPLPGTTSTKQGLQDGTQRGGQVKTATGLVSKTGAEAADAVLRVWREVAGIDGAEGRRDAQAARIGRAAADAVAACAVARQGQVATLFEGRATTYRSLLGDAEALATAVRERADEAWSLGPLTLPHMLVRLVVAEQLYRAAAMLANHPYHRA